MGVFLGTLSLLEGIPTLPKSALNISYGEKTLFFFFCCSPGCWEHEVCQGEGPAGALARKWGGGMRGAVFSPSGAAFRG